MVNELVKVQSTRDDSEHIAYIPVGFFCMPKIHAYNLISTIRHKSQILKLEK